MEALHSLEGRGETVTVGKRDAADNGMAATHPDKQGAVFISHSPNDRFYEGDAGVPGPSSVAGNTGTRSHVYASGGEAVAALLGLGITTP